MDTDQKKTDRLLVAQMIGPEWIVSLPGVEPGDFGFGLAIEKTVGPVIVIFKGKEHIGSVYKHPPSGEVCYTQHDIHEPPVLRKIALLQIIACMDRFDDVVTAMEKNAIKDAGIDGVTIKQQTDD